MSLICDDSETDNVKVEPDAKKISLFIFLTHTGMYFFIIIIRHRH